MVLAASGFALAVALSGSSDVLTLTTTNQGGPAALTIPTFGGHDLYLGQFVVDLVVERDGRFTDTTRPQGPIRAAPEVWEPVEMMRPLGPVLSFPWAAPLALKPGENWKTPLPLSAWNGGKALAAGRYRVRATWDQRELSKMKNLGIDALVATSEWLELTIPP